MSLRTAPKPSRFRALRIAAASTLALLPCAVLAQTDAGTYRADSELNVRAAPGIEGQLLGVIPPAAQVTVFACDAFGWCQVRYENLDGWAARQFLVRTGDLPPDTFALRFGTAPQPEGIVEIDGRLTAGGPCATLRADDGTAYALLGNVGFHPADAIHVIGQSITTDACGTATTLAVLYVRLDR